MKYDRLTPGILRRAIEIYAERAYPEGAPADQLPDLSKTPTIAEGLACFQNESGRDMEKKLHRYSLRLGNARYPFMKLVVQEVLIEGEYFFGVDTHDEMEVKPSFPDYEVWKQLRNFNAKLKEEIEKRWEQEGIPTCAGLRGLACDLIPENVAKGGRQRILVVDDEPSIREAIAALLAARGYLVETAAEGREALEKVDWVRPDLILLDYEMPGLDGLAALEKLREREETRKIPVLLATAGQISIEKAKTANAFLVKPFQTQVLFHFIEHLLTGAKKG